jgi:hypothetical protein
VGLKILYQDAEVVCVDKPPGLLTDTATREQEREDDSAKKRLDTWLAARDEKAWVCHRIDRDTSGVVVFARNEKAFTTLRESFANHVPDRFYWVAVFGIVIGDAGVWEDSMVWDPKIKRQVAVPIQTPGAVMARAEWRVIERHPVATLLEVKLDTGRRNQIRVHAALRGHPLVGEKIYLPPRSPQPLIRFPRQALHAWPAYSFGIVSILLLSPLLSLGLARLPLMPRELPNGQALFMAMPTTVSSGACVRWWRKEGGVGVGLHAAARDVLRRRSVVWSALLRAGSASVYTHAAACA